MVVGDDDIDEIDFERAPEHRTTVRIDPGSGSAARDCLDEQASTEILLARLPTGHADRVRTDTQLGV